MTTAKTPWGIILLLSATATAGYICRVNVATAGPLIMEEFHLSQVEMGRVFSVFLLGYALFQVPSGWLADRWGPRKVLSRAAWLWVFLTVIQSFTGLGPWVVDVGFSFIFFLLSRFLLGIAASPAYPGASKGVARWVRPEWRGRANGLVIGSVGLGSALASILVSGIMVHYGWRTALAVSALPALVMALLWKKVKEPIPVPAVTDHIDTTSTAQTNNAPFFFSSRFILLTASYTLQSYVGYTFVSWFYMYLVQERHFGLLEGAWMSSLPWVLSILSIPLGGWLSDHLAMGKAGPVWGSRLVPLLGLGLSGVFIAIGAHTVNALVAATTLALATAFVLCVEGPFWAMMTRISGVQSGKAGGVMNMGGNIGGLIAPMLMPLLARSIGWENALYGAALIAILSALLWLGIRPEPLRSKLDLHTDDKTIPGEPA